MDKKQITLVTTTIIVFGSAILFTIKDRNRLKKMDEYEKQFDFTPTELF